MPPPTYHAAVRPLVGITSDLREIEGSTRAVTPTAYARSVADAGGVPVLLAPIVELIPELIARCDAFLFTGGRDADTTRFGVPRHPAADLVHPERQAFETALLLALRDRRPEAPVLGVCLGMQMMALVSGGRLNQHLPDTLPTHAQHAGNRVHAVEPSDPLARRFALVAGEVCSSHHQTVEHPGSLTIVARAPDGVIEAVADPDRACYLGVQWHPERTKDPRTGLAVFRALIAAAPSARASPAPPASRRSPASPCSG